MARFRKKPVVIDAEQFQPDPSPDSTLPNGIWREAYWDETGKHLGYKIGTLEGPLWVHPGDWIITGVKGERYPCKPDIFALTYEPADEDTERRRRE